MWAVRVYKTRSVATDAIKNGKVTIGGQLVKASRDVKEGEVIEVKKVPIWRKYRVKQLLKSRVGAKLAGEYVEDITPQEELDRLESIKKAGFLQRRRGEGRPTKKERRDIDRMLDQPDEFFTDEEWPGSFDNE